MRNRAAPGHDSRVKNRYQGITEAVVALEGFQARLVDVNLIDSLNLSVLRGRTPVSALSFDDLKNFASTGNRVEATIQTEDWTATWRSGVGGSFAVSTDGPYEDVFADPAEIETARNAATNDPQSFWVICARMEASVQISLVHDAESSGFQWIRSEAALIDLANRLSWLELAELLLPNSETNELLLQDAEDNYLLRGGLVVRGPIGDQDIPVQPESLELGPYRRAWFSFERSEMTSPSQIEPIEDRGLVAVSRALNALTYGLVWAWIAGDVQKLADGTIRLTFNGTTLVSLPRTLKDRENPENELKLWRWAVATPEPRRREALQQAAALGIRSNQDLDDAAEPVLRTAEYFLRLTESGILTEALAARRSIRDAISGVALAVAEASRSAGRSALDRILIHVGAGAGLLLAQNANVISRESAILLVFILLASSGCIGYIIFCHDFPHIDSRVTAFKQDLALYRDVLSSEDIAELRRLPSMAAAEKEVASAKKHSKRVLLFAGLLLGGMLLASIFFVPSAGPRPSSEPQDGDTSEEIQPSPPRIA